MIEIKDNTLIITRDDGTEDFWKILFYYHNDERNRDYYLLFKDSDPDSLIVMATDDGKTLLEVSNEEFAEAEEMLETFENDPKMQAY